RLAGLMARGGGSPVTILGAARETAPGDGAAAAAIVRAGAGPAGEHAGVGQTGDVVGRGVGPPWDRDPSGGGGARVGTHVRHDRLVSGVDRVGAPDGGFHDRVSRLAHGFPGSIAVIAARGRHEVDPGAGPKILVPVTGSDVSRRGAEVALALGKAAETRVTAL